MSPDQDSSALVPPAEWTSARPPRANDVLVRLTTFPHLLVAYRDLVRTTLRRDLTARFQGTLLGWAWPLLQPLFLFAVYYFIFTELLQQKMPALPDEQKAAMGVYMFVGMMAWSAVGETLMRGTGVIVDNGNLIKKLSFPSELLPLNVILAALCMMLFGLAVFVLGACFTPLWPAPGWALLWVPVIVVLQGFFTYGLALFLSTLQVFLRDTAQVVAMVTTVWMFLTPVFWEPVTMGDKIAQHMPVIEANPAYHLVSAWRGALMGDLVVAGPEALNGGYAISTAALPGHVACFALWALAFYLVGYTFFVLSQRRFADEV